MCILCGKMEHTGMDLLEKAMKSSNAFKKEKPRFKALVQLEGNFKRQYTQNNQDMIDEVLKQF